LNYFLVGVSLGVKRKKPERTHVSLRVCTATITRINEVAGATTYASASRLAADMIDAAVEQIDDQDEPPRTPMLIARLRHQLRGAPAQASGVDTLADHVRALTNTVAELARRVDGLTPRAPVRASHPSHGRRTPGRA